MDVGDRIRRVRDAIERAAAGCGRDPAEITLIGVSKTVDRATAAEALTAGLTDLGENRVQSFLDKYEFIGDGASWHFIGHLQTNKVRQIIGKVQLIHSVDSIHLAEEISRRAQEAQTTAEILVQVNVAHEESKFGIDPAETEETVLRIAELNAVRVRGLMTIAPRSVRPGDSRKYFRELHKKFVDIKGKKYDNITMEILSMGMTGDFETAIQEGATMIRVGRGIFE